MGNMVFPTDNMYLLYEKYGSSTAYIYVLYGKYGFPHS